jgi:threonine/homoserine/homoserine lactone efflux protein
MPSLPTLAAFMVAALALNFTPGPDMLYVIARSVGQGRAAGIASALGIGAGTLVHTFFAALGLSALLMSLPVAFEVVKYAGAAYLVYLGIRTLRSKETHTAESTVQRESLGRIFRQGMITNVLNPKVAFFFLAFLPQFVDASRGPVAWQFILLGLLFNTSGTLVNCGVALLSSRAGGWLNTRPRVARLQTWFTGTVFLALGLRLALTERT